MIQQPELGKKIADLRKVKGLTQEELVEKCNLNVRTLQRIESGEVTPRIYTIRLIFEALEIPFDKSFESEGLILKWLEQFYINFIDLFNLKTNTMKKITILSIIITSIVIGLFTICDDCRAQKELKNENRLSIKIVNNDSLNYFIKINGNYNGWDNDDELIARDIECNIYSVMIKASLLKFNKKTLEFQTNYAKGKLEENTVVISNMDSKGIYSADNNIVVSEKMTKLIGNVRLEFPPNDIIQADEIIIFKE